MKILKLLIYIIILILFPHSNEKILADEGLSGLLEGIRSKYGDLPGFVVAYNLEMKTSSLDLLGEQMSDLATGKIYFKPPHFLMLKQETPKQETMIADGKIFWYYIPQKKQVYKSPLEKSGKVLRLISDIFQGLKKVDESFNVVRSSHDKEGEQRLKLTPNPPWLEIDYVYIIVAETNFSIRVVETHDHAGYINKFTFGSF